MTVSVREIILAVRYGDAALVGESAGYLVLGAADLALQSRGLASVDSVRLTLEGQVTHDGRQAQEGDVEASLRRLLGQLLQVVRTPARNLDRVAGRTQPNGLGGLVRELEAALVPVNRKAARRSLARLARETTKSGARERTYAEVESVLPPAAEQAAPLEQAVPVSTEVPSPIPEQVVWETVDVSPVPEVVEPAEEIPPLEAAAPPPPPLAPAASPPLVPAASPPLVPAASPPRSEGRLLATLAGWGARTPDELPLQRAVHTAVQEIAPRKRSFDLPDKVQSTVRSSTSMQSSEAPWEATSGSTATTGATTAPAEPGVLPDIFVEDEDLDQIPTQIFSRVAPIEQPPFVRETVDARPVGDSVLDGALALEVRPREVAAPPVRQRRRAPVVRRARRVIGEDVCLVSRAGASRARRPSEISDLLDKMWVEPQSPDDVFSGLKALSRVELSPLAPPVGSPDAESGS